VSTGTSTEQAQGERRRWLTPAQAADHCGVCISTLWKWVRTGVVTRHKPAGRVARFDSLELDQVMTNGAVKAQEQESC
jgi:hypothetical protein